MSAFAVMIINKSFNTDKIVHTDIPVKFLQRTIHQVNSTVFLDDALDYLNWKVAAADPWSLA